jgi:hypothetical protein
MEWQGVENDAVIQRTKYGSSRAHKYYYIWEKEEGKWTAGRNWFNREIDYQGLTFRTSAEARAYCEKKDREAVIIEEVTA